MRERRVAQSGFGVIHARARGCDVRLLRGGGPPAGMIVGVV